MGNEWLASISEILTGLGIRTQTGTPGRRAMEAGTTVAAVNLTGIDTAQGTMTVTVTVVTPRAEGVVRCQTAAAQAAAALAASGSRWSFDGWRYDSASDCYCIDVTGTRSMEPESTQTGLTGYEVRIGQTLQSHVTDFQASRQTGRRLLRAMGQAKPLGVTPGMGGWSIRLTQKIPGGEEEPETGEDSFTLTVKRGGYTQIFSLCGWAEYTSRQLEDCTEVVRSGFAVEREVIANE